MTVFLLKGTLTAEGPLTVSRPNAIKGRMPRLPNGLPYFPASTLNGLFRHAAHAGIVHWRRDKGAAPLSLDAHYMLAAGVDTARQISDIEGKPGAELPLRAANPLISLFGRWKLAGRLSMGDAVARTPECVMDLGDGVRTHPFRRKPELVTFVDPAELERLDAIMAADAESSEQVAPLKARIKELKRQMRTAEADEKKRLNQEIEGIEAQISGVKDTREGAKESVQRPLDIYEGIATGTVMDHEMRVQGGDGKELGALLWTLKYVASEPIVGGHRRSGCGRISGNWEVSRYDFGARAPVAIGTVGFSDAGLEIAGAALTSLLEAFEADLESGSVLVEQFG